jgi:hypothetical protein
MSNAVIGALRVVLGMDSAEFVKDTGKARKAAKDFEGEISGSFQRSLATIQNSLKGLAAGLVAGFAAAGLEGIVSSVRDVARGVAEVGDSAKKAGIDVEDFQRLAYVAQQNRIGIDALTDGIKEMNLRADEFILTGQGSGAEAFQRLGLNADNLRAKLQNPSDLFAEIIGKLSKLDKAAQIRISDEVFGGTGGEAFVQLLAEGGEGIRKLTREADSLGLVMSRELVDKAADLDRKFTQISATIGTSLKSAIVDTASAMAELAKSTQDFFAEYNKFSNARAGGAAVGAMFGATAAPAASERAAPKGSRLPGATDILRQKLIDQRVADAFSNTESSFTLPKEKKTGVSEAEKQAKVYEGVLQNLRDELSLVGQSDTAYRILNAQRQAGVEPLSAQGKEIAGLVTQTDELTAANERAQAAGEFFADSLTDAFEGLATGAKSLKESLLGMLQQVSSMFLNSALRELFNGNKSAGSSGAGFAGIFSSLFKSLPGFANEGTILPGGTGSLGGIDSQIVAFRKKPSEQVDIYHPGSARSSSGGTSVTYAPTINAPGATQEAVNALARAQAQDRQEFTRNVISTIRDAQKRRVI